MSAETNIQWCDSTVNPVMGCGGCELFPTPEKILGAIDERLSPLGVGWTQGKSKELFRTLIDGTYKAIKEPDSGHRKFVTTTNIWHLREEFEKRVKAGAGAVAADAARIVINQQVTCYAAKLHLNKGLSIVNPGRQPKKGYAPTFEIPTRYDGRVAAMAMEKDLFGRKDPDRPWIDGLPRLIFVSDMGDAFTRKTDFGFLIKEVIEPIRSPEGKRHLWLWLTKRPELMAAFSEQIGDLPENVCAMTTVTGPDSLDRIDKLRQVKASVRGLSLEPLWERIPPKRLNLERIDWLILGGESGSGEDTRPFALEWAEQLRDHCAANKGRILYEAAREDAHEGPEIIQAQGSSWRRLG